MSSSFVFSRKYLVGIHLYKIFWSLRIYTRGLLDNNCNLMLLFKFHMWPVHLPIKCSTTLTNWWFSFAAGYKLFTDIKRLSPFATLYMYSPCSTAWKRFNSFFVFRYSRKTIFFTTFVFIYFAKFIGTACAGLSF